jgi:hypothetical protein
MCSRPARPSRADPSLTIYNQNFAVVRDTVPLDLKAGENDVSFADTTRISSPTRSSCAIRAAKVNLQILEQNYRNDPGLAGAAALALRGQDDRLSGARKRASPTRSCRAKSSAAATSPIAGLRCSTASSILPAKMADRTSQPIIEVDGKIQFGLPGQPIFPSLGDDTILKPTLTWKMQASDAPAKLDAELAYITRA